VGPFNFTHVTRSFDGVRGVWDSPAWNATALAVRPTHGGFEVSANREIGDVGLAGLALTKKGLPWCETSDLRLFWLYYEDARDNPTKVDNRPFPVRAADHDEIVVHTVGAHAVAVADADRAAPTGSSGGRYRRANGDATGTMPGPGPSRRATSSRASRGGHGCAAAGTVRRRRRSRRRQSPDVLPAPADAAYLRAPPFYNLMNIDDVFAQILLQPHSRVQARVDYHRLRVTEGGDLWYSGGGATNDDVFGFSGSPAAGRHELGHLVDLSLTVTLPWRVTLGSYYGHAFGGGVVGATFAGRDADYGFVEATYRY
jgi:hypothetical protein